MLRHAQLYSNSAFRGLNAFQYHEGRRPASDGNGSPEPDRLSVNVTRNMVDAVQAKITKNRPRVSFLTEGGRFGLQQKARNLEKFVWGVGYKNRMYELGPQVFRDAGVFSYGCAKVFSQVRHPDKSDKKGKPTGFIRYERVFPWEIYVDPVDAVHGRPRSLYQMKLIDKYVLAEMFPKKRMEIMEARMDYLGDDVIDTAADRYADQVLVVEAWHLPSGPGAKDGRNVIAISGATLADNSWERDRFPFSFIRWSRPLIGFWGESLVGEVEGINAEINELASKIQTAMYYNAVPRVLVDRSAKVEFSDINNDERGAFVEYDQIPPTVVAGAPVAAQVFSHFDRLISLAFEVAGVSQLSAQSQKPAGLNSGVALQEFNDIESERFVLRGQDYELFYMDLAELTIQEARSLYELGIDVEVVSQDRRRRRHFLTRIKWSEVNMEDDAFEMKIFPASSLPQTPAGRKAAIESLYGAGLIDKATAQQQLDLPDLEGAMSLELAPYEILMDMIEQIIDDGRFVGPEPYMDLPLGLKVFRNAYLRAKLDRVPERELGLMRKWIQQAEKLMRPPAEEAPAVPPELPPDGGGEALPLEPGQPLPPEIQAA